MKRVWISLSILVSMIGISIFFSHRIIKECEELINLVELTQQSINSGDKESALRYAEDFSKNWQNFHNQSIIMLKGDKISEIENCYIRIIPLINAENDELSAELAELKSILIHTKASEYPTLYNIF